MPAASIEVYVITGSTRGIGYGLGRELLHRDQIVIVNGRSAASVDKALSRLTVDVSGATLVKVPPTSASDYTKKCLAGFAADVRDKNQLQNLFDFAVSLFGRVDCWINNAAVSPDTDWQTMSAHLVSETLATNIAGTLFGCQVAAAGMKKQIDGGRIYFVEGLGSDGRQVNAFTTVYGATKFCNSYLAESVAATVMNSASSTENVLDAATEQGGTTSDLPVLLATRIPGSDDDEFFPPSPTTESMGKVRIGRLQPGMVMTDLLLGRYRRDPSARSGIKKIFNILADLETTVTPWLADGLVGGKLVLRWLTVGVVLKRFLLAPFSTRDLFEEVDREIAAGENSSVIG